MSDVQFTCMRVKLVPAAKVMANDYNPNAVASTEMELLKRSIEADGLTQPVVVFHDKRADRYVVVDGFHRFTLLKNHFRCEQIPVVEIEKEMHERMASTIRHNRARGKHQVDLMGALVKSLMELGRSDDDIAAALGMSIEELLRLKQIVGAAKLLAGVEYSASYGRDDEPDYPDEQLQHERSAAQ